jgi:FKBP-type peptidyl-prolyl cis-trans isomerase SlyD
MSDELVEKNKVVGITYSILDASGVILEQSDLPVYYLHGGPNQMFAEVEAALEGCGMGESAEAVIPPEKAFGYHDPALTFTDAIDNVPPEIRKLGAEVQMQNDRGEVRTFFVSRIEDGKLTVDGNHPFAGKTLTYAVTVVDIRDASEQEKRNGVSAPVIH